ncbi:MAG: class II SORL domain-containing protein [Coriobacteriales bacterium]|nr:class II SORL domain-containing protein [Coriobacteriales bacterium]
MSDSVEFENAVTEVNDGLEQDVHSVEDIDTASDFELKHTPAIELEELKSGQLIKVSIGLKGIEHPQTEEHFIEWIRLFVGTEPVGERAFGPGDDVQASFEIERSSAQVIAQALCNLHGLWEARI